MESDRKYSISTSVMANSALCPLRAYMTHTMGFPSGDGKSTLLRNKVYDIFSTRDIQAFEEAFSVLAGMRDSIPKNAYKIISDAPKCRKYIYSLMNDFSVYHDKKIDVYLGNFRISGRPVNMFKESDEVRRIVTLKIGAGRSMEEYARFKLKSFLFMLKGIGVNAKGSLLNLGNDSISDISLDSDDEHKLENGLYMLESLIKNPTKAIESRMESTACAGHICAYKEICHPELSCSKKFR